jgi:DNA-binding beta-propeller fold protein YncE
MMDIISNRLGSNLSKSSAFLALMIGCFSCTLLAATPTAPPFSTDVIGTRAPANFYVVDIATDLSGNIHVIDPFYKTLTRYAKDGSMQLEISNPDFNWLRGLTVDSQGRMYVLDPVKEKIHVYNANGNLLDVWFGFGGAESMDVDSDDNVYVALGGTATGTPQVAVFDPSGTELFRFGSFGTGPGQFRRPHDVAVAPDGPIYVADESNQTVQKFDSLGNHLLTIGIGQSGSLPGEFKSPVSVSVDSNGNLYVSDRRNNRIQKFDSAGNFLLEWGDYGTGPGQFIEHHGIAVAPDDTIWVAGYHGHDVQHFDGQGNLIQRWQEHVSGPGEFSVARGIAISNDNLFVVDGWNQRVQAFDMNTGQFAYEFGKRGQGDATVFNFPREVTAGPNGDLYISDDDHVRRIQPDGTFVMRYPRPTGNRPGSMGLEVSTDGFLYMAGRDEVVKYDIVSGTIVARWGSSGSGPGQFKTTRGVAIGPNGTLYVADTGNGRVQLFNPDGNYLGEIGNTVGDPVKLQGPSGVAIDPERGVLYVADAWANRVVAYDLLGNFLFYWGFEGSGQGQFQNIWGIAIGEQGTVYVSEIDNGRVQVFSYPIDFSTNGRPAYLKGGDLGYFLWQDTDDGEWHLRWSGDGVAHVFDMTITSTVGSFSSVRPFSFEGRDALRQTANEILITGYTSTWEDGLDFFATPGAVLKFDLRIDDTADAASVFIGGAGTNPSSNPVFIAPQLPDQEVFSISGAPVYRPGKTVGYYLWQDAIDGEWHLRWNSDGVNRNFTGSIASTGLIGSVVPVEWEFQQDSYFVDSYVLGFNGKASTWHDGLDFRVPDGATLLLNLAIDGVEIPAQVFVGSDSSSPTALPFSLTSLPAASTADALGKPTFIGAGDLGYFVWVDASKVWHVRANPDGDTHTFNGVIQTEDPITSLVPVNVENNDILIQSGQTIDWNMSAATWYDGFDFTVQGSGRIMFDVSLDGISAEMQTYTGPSRTNPANNPFTFNASVP